MFLRFKTSREYYFLKSDLETDHHNHIDEHNHNVIELDREKRVISLKQHSSNKNNLFNKKIPKIKQQFIDINSTTRKPKQIKKMLRSMSPCLSDESSSASNDSFTSPMTNRRLEKPSLIKKLSTSSLMIDNFIQESFLNLKTENSSICNQINNQKSTDVRQNSMRRTTANMFNLKPAAKNFMKFFSRPKTTTSTVVVPSQSSESSSASKSEDFISNKLVRLLVRQHSKKHSTKFNQQTSNSQRVPFLASNILVNNLTTNCSSISSKMMNSSSQIHSIQVSVKFYLFI